MFTNLLDALLRPHAPRPTDSPPPPPSVSALVFAQQRFLTERRLELAQTLRDTGELNAEMNRIRKQVESKQSDLRGLWLNHLLDKTHEGTWDDIYPMLEAFHDQKDLHPGIICVLGGWHASTDVDADAKAAPERLVNRTLAYGVVIEVIKAWERKDAARAKKLIRDFDTCFHPSFQEADIERVVEHLQSHHPKLATLIEGLLLWNIPNTLSFFPSADDPAEGWKDCYRFAWGFHRLPDAKKQELGPYTVLIQRLETLTPPATSQPQTPPGDSASPPASTPATPKA